MPDICVFYASEDEKRVRPIVDALKSCGWNVWWDQKITQGNWVASVEKACQDTKCAIPIWTKTSIKTECQAMNEALHAKELGKPLLHVLFDNVSMPIPFKSEKRYKFYNWKGSLEDPTFVSLRNAVKELTENSGRPKSIKVGGKTIEVPAFVRSVSSHETFIGSPTDALTALNMMPGTEPVLVSVFDLFLNDKETDEKKKKEHREQRGQILEKVKELSRRGCPIMLDSGNYEASRKGQLGEVSSGEYSGLVADGLWDEKKYLKALGQLNNELFDGIFCYDKIYPESADEVVENIKSGLKKVGGGKGLPIVHAPYNKENGSRDTSCLPEVFYKLSIDLKPALIAVPERELGDGIYERARNVKKIREKLNELGYYQPIHLLGTGNPLSVAILAAAGADLFDGLEWCRTVVNRTNGQLFHYQQFDLFKSQTAENGFYEMARKIVDSDSFSYRLKVAVHNLDFFSEWIGEIRDLVSAESVNEYFARYAAKEFEHPFCDEQGFVNFIKDLNS